MNKLSLVLLVLLPLVLAVDIQVVAFTAEVNGTAGGNTTTLNATNPVATVATPAVALNATNNATVNATSNAQNASAPALSRPIKPIDKVAQLVAKIKPAPRRARPPRNATRQTKPKAPKLSPTAGEALIEFYLRTPNSVIGQDKELFSQRIIQELAKGVEQPARRFEILSVTPGHNSKTGPLVRLRIHRVTPRDDPRSLGAQDLATTFYDRAMDPANVWVNLPLLGHVDRTKAIIVNVTKWAPRPKEPPIHAQIKVDIDIRKIEPRISAYLRTVEVDIAAAVGCEPEQIEVTGAEPADDGLSLTSLVIHFDVFSRLRELPEKELTPTNIVNEIKKQLLDPASPLRVRPTLVRADAFFPVQNILPKTKKNPDWVRDQEQYQVAEIRADPVKYARPYVLPTLYVSPPPAPAPPAPVLPPKQ